MKKDYNFRNMLQSDLLQAINIWQEQVNIYCNDKYCFPDYWIYNTNEVEKFLKEKTNNRTVIVAEFNDKIIGFLGYIEAPFNGEESVYIPVALHAVLEDYKEEVYPLLYQYVSQIWINKNIFNHMWTINYRDEKLRKIMFDIGFGSYLIDAFNSTKKIVVNTNQYKKIRANENHVKVLYNLVEESRHYYSLAPLFLKRSEYTLDRLIEVINQHNVFIALDNDIPIGFINISISENNNVIELYTEKTGLIDEIGIYVKDEYRNKGVDKVLLSIIFQYCEKKV